MRDNSPSAARLVAFVVASMRPGGVEHVRLQLIQELLARGFLIDLVLLRAEGDLLGKLPSTCRVFDLDTGRAQLIWWRLHKYLRHRRPHGVLASNWPLTGLSAFACVTAGTQTSLVVSEHNNPERNPMIQGRARTVMRQSARYLYRRASAVVTVSEGVRCSLASFTGFPLNRMRVIYNPVRPVSDAPLPPESQALFSWWKDSAASLISIGSLKAQKDYPTLFRALSLLAARCRLRLLVLGEGRERQSLERLIAELGLEDFVRLGGYHPDPYPFLRDADVFILSSAYEGLANVLLEALAAGVPVVSTDCPFGPSEILAGGRYGRLVPPGDSVALAEAVEATLSARHDRDTLAGRAREFSVSRAADSYLDALDL